MTDAVSSALAAVPLFAELNPAQLARIAGATRTLNVDRGAILFQRGDPATGFYLVREGQMKLSLLTPNGEEKVLEILGPGMTFGEAVMFLGKPYPALAQALAPTELLHIARAAVVTAIREDPEFAQRMLAGLSWRLHRLVAHLEDVTLHSAKQRVIGYLLRNDREADSGEVRLPAGKAVVASRLAITPETFSRVLHELTEAGLIRVEGRSIALLDVARLRAVGTGS